MCERVRDDPAPLGCLPLAPRPPGAVYLSHLPEWATEEWLRDQFRPRPGPRDAIPPPTLALPLGGGVDGWVDGWGRVTVVF